MNLTRIKPRDEDFNPLNPKSQKNNNGIPAGRRP
jgi:hypothetical protein